MATTHTARARVIAATVATLALLAGCDRGGAPEATAPSEGVPASTQDSDAGSEGTAPGEDDTAATEGGQAVGPVPEGLEAVPVDMEPGDVLFFNGSLVHGSGPNRSADRFRRSFIGHYIGRSSERISAWYRPILTMEGEEVVVAENTDGGPCGVEVDGPH